MYKNKATWLTYCKTLSTVRKKVLKIADNVKATRALSSWK